MNIKVLLSVLMIVGVVFLIVLQGVRIFQSVELEIMYQRCCKGYICSDTYLDTETNECVLVLSGERYKADNLSAEWIINNTITAT